MTGLEDRAEELGSGRGLTGLAIGMFVPVTAIWLISLIALFPIGVLFGVVIGSTNTGVAIVCIGWTLGAGLAFIRPVEEWLGRAIFELRSPTPYEIETLQPLWNAVCEETEVDPSRYILKVENSPHPNALAAAGRLVAVTNGAIEQLPADMLQGILAHELGHHRDLHPVAALLTWWYLLPIGLLDWCLRVVVRTSAFILSFFRGWLILLLLFALLMLLLVRFLFFIPVKTAYLIGLMMGRASEYRADRYATESGYGPGLLRALQLFLGRGLDEDLPRGIARLYNSHPPLKKRIRAIEKRLEKLDSTHQPAAATMTWRIGA
jgi:Zn-dependent protease with chaperone function